MNSTMSSPLFLCISLSILSFILPTLSTPSPLIPSSYIPLCSSTLPHSTPTALAYDHHLPSFTTPHFSGGDRLFPHHDNHFSFFGVKSLNLQIQPNCHKTIIRSVYMIQASLYISSPYTTADIKDVTNGRKSRGMVKFSLTGFWSTISSTACMVGTAVSNSMNFTGVLKLKYPRARNPHIRTSVASGTLESTSSEDDPTYFDTISMFHFPTLSGYGYSLIANEIESLDDLRSLNLGPSPSQFCDELPWSWNFLDMEYGTECKEPRNCSPLGNTTLPSRLYLNPIQCSGYERRIRYMARFENQTYSIYGSFAFESTLIAEGLWDDENNRLLIGACRLLNPIDYFGVPVGNCHIRISLRNHSVWTIKEDSRVIGQLWRTRRGNDDDNAYFRKINLTRDSDINVPGLRYDYTEMERVQKLCLMKNPVKMQGTYPDGKSRNMKFDVSVLNLKGEHCGWGYMLPLFVGNETFRNAIVASVSMSESVLPTDFEYNSRARASVLNISYKISFTPCWEVNSDERTSSLMMSTNHRGKVEINAEGIYDAETGQLCMVGCRKLRNLSNISTDCEIVMKFEFPLLDAKDSDRINGTISSTRLKGDPLHFEELTLSAAAFYSKMATETISWMELEIILAMVYHTLFGIFVGAQILHVKRNPEIASSISLMMTLILALQYIIALTLSIMGMLLENDEHDAALLNKARWLEAREMASWTIGVVTLWLQIQFLQLVWTVKWNDKSSWDAERMPWFVAMMLYTLGALFTLLISHVLGQGHQNYSLWDNLKSYTCLILNGCLFPQIILNVVRGSTEKALSHLFYIGTSVDRLAPYAYYQYRMHNYPQTYINGTYYHADLAGEFRSTAWDVVIPFGVVVMATVIHLQQQHGGRWIVPWRFRELEPITDIE